MSYADAVRLLGGEGKIVRALEQITGGLALVTAVTGSPAALLGWLGARGEFVRLSHELIRTVSERRSGLSRYSRTQRLEAAHAVLVVVAYFEALAEADLPFPFDDLELTREEQVRLAGGDVDADIFINTMQLTVYALPESFYAHERQREKLTDYYYDVSSSLKRFLEGLGVWDRLRETDRGRLGRTLVDAVPQRAVERYEELLRRLATEFPEVAFWANLREHEATRMQVHVIEAAMSGLERMLVDISTGRAPDERREGLARAYRAALDRPIITSGDVPEGLRLPTLGTGYISPVFRVGVVTNEVKPSEESWWSGVPIRDDLEEFLVGYLTSSQATRAPLLVLGQPGAGKSVLTRILAARLPAADFLPVRVVLRDVPAAADLQDQIEHAIRDTTGERIEWPALVRTAGDALPVVILDGFDELLQATGVAQTDYLRRIAELQLRESDQDRPMAVIVTSRTSVADRARVPDGAVAIRLEPFDSTRVAAWLSAWNSVNAEPFRGRGLAPLTAEAVLAYPELASQPLLLLMLALYDASGNTLQRSTTRLRQADLYERLLRSFARREVEKHQPGLPERDLERAVEHELRRLSVVAFAMFNRGSQWVTEADLEADLPALLGEQPSRVADGVHDLRAPLRVAEVVLGRFFFIHRAQASRDDRRLETYEFLHATFSEYLVARLTWQVLRDIAVREAASTMPLSGTPVNDDLLHALLSFAVLSQRAPIINFLAEAAASLKSADRAATTEMLMRLFQVVHHPRHSRGYLSYQPRAMLVPTRHAAYAANLVLLTVCAAGSIRASQLYGTGTDPVPAWKNEAMLWRSQLRGGDQWPSIVGTLRLSQLWDGQQRDLQLELTGVPGRPTIDLFWTLDVSPDDEQRARAFSYFEQSPDNVYRTAHFLSRQTEGAVHHTLESFSTTLGPAVNTIIGWRRAAAVSAARALLDAWLLPLHNPTSAEQREVYELCAEIATTNFPSWDDTINERYAALLLDRLSTDRTVPLELVANILSQLDAASSGRLATSLAPRIVRCGLTFLGRDPAGDARITAVVRGLVDSVPPELAQEARRALGR